MKPSPSAQVVLETLRRRYDEREYAAIEAEEARGTPVWERPPVSIDEVIVEYFKEHPEHRRLCTQIDLGKLRNYAEVTRTLKELAKRGFLEDSGERRPGNNGVMQVAWRISPRGRLVGDYQERFGLTFKQAMALVAETTFG